jgi:hypothetical protein
MFSLFEPPSASVFHRIMLEKKQQVEQRLSGGIEGYKTIAVGSSYAQFAFVPKGLNQAYNAAIGGYVHLDRQYWLIKDILKQGRPQQILYFVDDIGINKRPYKRRFHPLFRPFVSWKTLKRRNTLRRVREAIRDRELPCNRAVNLDLSLFSKYHGWRLHADGWVEADGVANTSNPSVSQWKSLQFSPQQESIGFLRAMLEANGKRIVMVQPPVHSSYSSNSNDRVERTRDVLKRLAEEHSVQFIEPGFPCDNADLFFDASHLNASGAILFSEQLAKAL